MNSTSACFHRCRRGLLRVAFGCLVAAPVASAMRGDFDGDGRWTARDAEAALQMSAGLRAVDLNLDVDNDALVMSSDARIILQGFTTGQTIVAAAQSMPVSSSRPQPPPDDAAAPVATSRIWTDSKGRKVEAVCVGLDGDKISLQTDAGKIFTFALSNLSAADQALAKTMKPAPPAPAKDSTAQTSGQVPAPAEHPKSTATIVDPPAPASSPAQASGHVPAPGVPTFAPAIGPPPAAPAPVAAIPPPEGSVDDFADPTIKAVSSSAQTSGHIPAPAKATPSSADLNAFARGQAKYEAAKNAPPVKADYAEAGRLDKALKAAEDEHRRAVAEAKRLAQAQAAAAAQQEAQRREQIAYQNWLAQKQAYDNWCAQQQAYNDWVARQNAARQAAQQVWQYVQPSQPYMQQPQGGGGAHHNGGVIRDAPQ